MCTVSFVRTADQHILTSNRDESINRPSAKPLQTFQHAERQLFYPQDPLGGGSWFCVDDLGRVIILLNGAEEKHKHQPPYRKSRGLILLDLMEQPELKNGWDLLNLTDIEPFTLVCFTNGHLFQFRWNGREKEYLLLNSGSAQIWSSSTLYSKDIRNVRKQWFEEFLHENPNPSPEKMLYFHQNAGKHDPHNGLLMNREEKLLTKNISQCVIHPHGARVLHRDLVEQFQNEIQITFKQS
ncbi:MAG: NRDE family protein [Saprospiraceae bacterium]|nr:NRDE family protein [Saprospiraceae bacterium]